MSDIMEIKYDGFKAINVSNSYISLTTIPSLGSGEVKLSYPDIKESMVFRFNKDILGYCGIWIDRAGWPFNENPYRVLAIEPCNCISDRFEDSVQRGAFDTVKAKSYNEWKLELVIEQI